MPSPDYKPLVDRKPDSPYFGGRQRHLIHLVPPLARVREQGYLFRQQFGVKHIRLAQGALPDQLLGQQLVFEHGKAMPLGEFVAVNRREGYFEQGC